MSKAQTMTCSPRYPAVSQSTGVQRAWDWYDAGASLER